MSRHLIFILPFFAFTVAEGLLVVGKLLLRRAAPVFVLAAVASIVSCEVAWGWQKTPELYRGEPHSRVAARNAASAWLAAISRPDDVLFAYEPVYLDAWARDANLSKLVIPRADYKLALKTLQQAQKPLGHAVWVFDASDTTNYYRRSTIKLVYPEPASAFESRAFGPYLVIRTVNPVRTIRTYLKLSRRVEIVGWQLAIGDADVNAVTVLQASNRLAHQQRAKAAASG
jgi:hypothetical protein